MLDVTPHSVTKCGVRAFGGLSHRSHRSALSNQLRTSAASLTLPGKPEGRHGISIRTPAKPNACTPKRNMVIQVAKYCSCIAMAKAPQLPNPDQLTVLAVASALAHDLPGERWSIVAL